MKKKLLTFLGLSLLVCCVTACGSNNTAQNNSATTATEDTTATEKTVDAAADTVVAEEPETVENQTYEFETFDGQTVVINESNIVSQEACEEPLEWAGLPTDAEQQAPGRDLILFADSNNYYVEDVTNKLVTIAIKEVGDVIEETDYAIFDNDAFSFQYDPEYFVVNEDDEYVTVSFYNEETPTAGSNTITFKEIENADALEVAKELAAQYGIDEASIQESNFGASGVTAYSATISSTSGPESDNQTRAMACAVVNGDNVIAIEVFNHVEPDEGMDMFINDKIAEVLDTFTID